MAAFADGDIGSQQSEYGRSIAVLQGRLERLCHGLGLGCRLRLHALQRKRGFGRGRGGRRMIVVIFRSRAMAVPGLTGHVHAFHVGSTGGVQIGRAPGGGRVCPYVLISVVGAPYKQKGCTTSTTTIFTKSTT